LQKHLTDEIQKFSIRMDQDISAANGGMFLIQGNFHCSTNKIQNAAKDFAYAIELLIKGQDEQNAQRALNNLLEECFPKLINISIEDFTDLNESIQVALKALETVNVNGRYSDYINKIKRGLEQIKNKKIKEEISAL